MVQPCLVKRLLQNSIKELWLELPYYRHCLAPIRYSGLCQALKKKEYRVILYEKFYIVYSVTNKTVTVLTIIHQATKPKTLSKIK